MLGWLTLSLVYFGQLRQWRLFGLGTLRPRPVRVLSLFCSLFVGITAAWGLLALSGSFPLLTGFVLALPQIHRSLVHGNVWLFLALIPFGQLTHELFYRGFLQQELARRLRAPVAAIALSTVLYAWTHVFIFSSLEFASDLRSVAGQRFGGLQDVRTTLAAVVAYSMVESILSGIALLITRSIWPSVLIRSSLLVSVCFVLFRRYGLL
jgi:membrane protease YdiL (CAAX protease family)